MKNNLYLRLLLIPIVLLISLSSFLSNAMYLHNRATRINIWTESVKVIEYVKVKRSLILIFHTKEKKKSWEISYYLPIEVLIKTKKRLSHVFSFWINIKQESRLYNSSWNFDYINLHYKFTLQKTLLIIVYI